MGLGLSSHQCCKPSALRCDEQPQRARLYQDEACQVLVFNMALFLYLRARAFLHPRCPERVWMKHGVICMKAAAEHCDRRAAALLGCHAEHETWACQFWPRRGEVSLKKYMHALRAFLPSCIRSLLIPSLHILQRLAGPASPLSKRRGVKCAVCLKTFSPEDCWVRCVSPGLHVNPQMHGPCP